MLSPKSICLLAYRFQTPLMPGAYRIFAISSARIHPQRLYNVQTQTPRFFDAWGSYPRAMRARLCPMRQEMFKDLVHNKMLTERIVKCSEDRRRWLLNYSHLSKNLTIRIMRATDHSSDVRSLGHSTLIRSTRYHPRLPENYDCHNSHIRC